MFDIITAIFFDENQINNFLKKKQLSKNYIYFPLTPNANLALKNLKIKSKIILPLENFDDKCHKEIIDNVSKIEKKLEIYLDKNKYINLSSISTFKSIFHLSLSSAYYIRTMISNTKSPWLILLDNEWKLIHDFDQACLCLIQNLINNKKGVFREFRTRSYNFNFIINFINKIIFKLHSKKIVYWSTGLNYGLKNLITEYSKNKNSIFFYLGPADNFGILRTFSSILKSINPFNNYSEIMITPTLKNNYNNNFYKEIKKINFDDKFFDFIKIDILKFVNNFIIYTEDLKSNVDELLELSKPNLVIAHQLRMLEPAVLGSLAKNKNVKVKLISHGSHPMQSEKYSSYENKKQAEGLLYSNFASSVVLQSPIAEETYKFYTNQKKFEKYKPIMWGYKKNYKTKITKNEYEFTILYAGTLKSLGIRPWIYETSNEFFASIEILIDILKNFKKVKLIIKARENDECSIENLKFLTKNINNCSVETDGDFLEYLNISDLLISYSSTTIEEALNYKKPVAIYGYSNRYIHINESNSSSNLKPVYNLTIKNLKIKLPMIIETLKKNKVPNNFFDSYIYNDNSKDLINFIRKN